MTTHSEDIVRYAGHTRAVSDRLAYALARGIRAERNRAGRTIADLAGELHWSPAKLQAVESGTRTLAAGDLADVCRALRQPLRRILIDADPEDLEALGL